MVFFSISLLLLEGQSFNIHRALLLLSSGLTLLLRAWVWFWFLLFSQEDPS